MVSPLMNIEVRAELYATRLAGKRTNRRLGILLAYCVLLISGCATASTSTVQSQVIQTLQNKSVKATRTFLPSVFTHTQVADGSVWAVKQNWFFPSHAKINLKSYQITEFSRPFSVNGINLLVDEHSIWFSNLMTSISGRGDLYRVAQDNNQVIATIEAVGAPFAIGNGAVWTYNNHTQKVTGIDVKNNQIRTQFVTLGDTGEESFTFAAGSIWQLGYEGDVSKFRLSNCDLTYPLFCVIPPGVVRRIDPQTKKVIAEIPIGPYYPSDRLRTQRPSENIRFVAGAIWVLGERDNSNKSLATRIDVKTNLVEATIPLVRSMEGKCSVHSFPKTPVFWNGGLWISTFCTDKGGMPSVLLKIDLEKNQVTDELGLPTYRGFSGQPALVAGAGALWGFDGRSIIRFDFLNAIKD